MLLTYDFLKEKAKNRRVFPISFHELNLEEPRPLWQMEWIVPGMILDAQEHGVDIQIFLCYDDKKYIFITEEFSMCENQFCIPIPYQTRENYELFILEVNQIVSCSGSVMLAVCNNPYQFCSYLLIECSAKEADSIKTLAAKYNLSLNFEKGPEEILKDVSYGDFWKVMTLVSGHSETLLLQIRLLYEFPSIQDLENAGIKTHKNAKRPKVFVSYCHKDKDIVRPIVDDMNESGVNAWFDAKDIDIGDDILEEIMIALEKCPLAILFLSQNYKDSFYAKWELRSFLDHVIRNKKRIFPILIDDIRPDDIYAGLGRYSYFKFDNNTTELLSKLNTVIEKIGK